MNSLYLMLFSLFTVASCNKIFINSNVKDIEINKSQNKINGEMEVFYKLDDLKNVKILLMSKLYSISDTNELNKMGCTNWFINKKILEDVFEKMIPVSNAYELFSLCYRVPCSYGGQFVYKRDTVDFNISASSVLTFHYKEKPSAYVLNQDDSAFLMVCDSIGAK